MEDLALRRAERGLYRLPADVVQLHKQY
ncbi:hypothetical protein NFI96_008205, partial [Prochilodus magdalenae]